MTLRKKQESVRDYDVVRKTTCCNCPAGCGLKVFVKGRTSVDVCGDEEHPANKGSICQKGLLGYFHLANPRRIIHPGIRESVHEPFRAVKWDEALSFAANKVQDLAKKRGTNSLYVHGDDFSPFDYLAGAGLFARCFGTPHGPSRFFPYPFGNNGHIKRMFGVAGSQLLMNAPRDWGSSRCILLYGCDLAASEPITFGHILDARDRGVTLLAIDSRKTITSSKATLSLRVKPGTKGIALKGIVHLLIKRGLIEKEFLEEAATDFSGLESEVEPFNPQRIAELCWVRKEHLERMADLIGRARPVQVISGSWNTRQSLGEEELFMCGVLVCLRGSVGIPGGGLNFLNVSPFSWEGQRSGDEKKAKEEGGMAAHLFLENILGNRPDHPSVLIWHGNPCSRMAGGKKTKSRLEAIPLIVHLSSYPNETYHYSHVSFPMSSWLEYPGLAANNNGRAIQWHHKVVDAPGECKSPIGFWSDLSHSLGFGEDFPWRQGNGAIDEQWAAESFLRENPLTRAVSIEKLDPERNAPGGLLWPCIEEGDLEFEESRFLIGRIGNVRGKNILFEKGKNYPLSDKRFPTFSGKISLSPPDRQEDHDSLKDHESKATTSASNSSDPHMRFPLMLITGVLPEYVEDFGYFVTDRDPWTPNSMVQIHPRVGKILNIMNREMITVENDRGAFTARAWLNEDLDPHVIWCPEGADPYQPIFACESPHSLFEEPADDYVKKSFSMVRVRPAGATVEKDQQELVRLLKDLSSK